LFDLKQLSTERLEALTEALEPVFEQAGQAILTVYRQPTHRIETKTDASPVTDADLMSHDIMVAALARLTPDWPIISEEDSALHTGAADVSAAGFDAAQPWWCLDPLDGTKEFIARTDEFSINLGLVVNARAAFGFLYSPTERILYRGGLGIPAQKKVAGGAWTTIACRTRAAGGGVLISSRRSTSMPEGENFDRRDVLGSALKFGRIAEGIADVYLRKGPTMEWDTCAGQAIVEAAGGHVLTLDRLPLRYGKSEFRNMGFVATGRTG
jgi:3'(2'), 5'-bisphosphate nucleotidase